MDRPDASGPRPDRPATERLFQLGWLVAGTGLAVGVLGLASIGIFVLPAALLLIAALLASRRGLGGAPAALLTGAGLGPLYVAYLNRGGPGTVCVTTATSQSCTEEWDPWPWLGVGLALVVASLVLCATLRRRAS